MSKCFDFVVKAEKVVIKEKGDNNYKVKLAGLSDFLKYQVWSNTNANNINGDRSVFLLRAKDWVEQFKIVNSNNSIRFIPTTVIEIDNKKYVTVITNAEFKNKKVIFHMSTDDVKFNSKKMEKMNKLPKGEFLNVRFDIDDGGFNLYCYNQCKAAPDNSGVEPVTCYDVCNGTDYCFNQIKTQTNIDGVESLFQAYCSDINEITSASPSDQFSKIQQDDLGFCSLM
jgi:hypothetical protein